MGPSSSLANRDFPCCGHPRAGDSSGLAHLDTTKPVTPLQPLHWGTPCLKIKLQQRSISVLLLWQPHLGHAMSAGNCPASSHCREPRAPVPGAAGPPRHFAGGLAPHCQKPGRNWGQAPNAPLTQYQGQRLLLGPSGSPHWWHLPGLRWVLSQVWALPLRALSWWGSHTGIPKQEREVHVASGVTAWGSQGQSLDRGRSGAQGKLSGSWCRAGAELGPEQDQED